MPNRLQNGNPAYYPSEYIILNIIQTFRYSLRPQANNSTSQWKTTCYSHKDNWMVHNVIQDTSLTEF